MYLTKHQIEWNWRHVDIKIPPRLKVLKGHDDHVVCVYHAICSCDCFC